MNYREKIRKYIECPQVGNRHYGEWGILTLQQREYIKRLLDELDRADVYIKKLFLENQQLKENLKEQEQEYNRMFGLWNNRKYIKKFNKEYDEEDKKNNPDRDYASVYPDAEEIYKRYYSLKEKLERFEKANKEAIEYININGWEICSKYDCMCKDDILDVLRILDTDKGE